MSRNKILIALSLLCAAFAADNLPRPATPDNGKRLFVKLGCYTCHGYQGQGGGAGAKLAPHPIPAAALIAYVRHPAGTMPPFTSKVASDAELTDIRAYLASVPEPPPAKNIPLLNQ